MMKNQKKKMHHPRLMKKKKTQHPRLKRNQKKEKLTPQQMMIRNQRMKNPVKRAHLNGQKRFQPKSIWILQNRWRQSNTREENLLSMWQGSIHVSSQGQTLVR